MTAIAYFRIAPRFVTVTALGAVIMIAGAVNIALHALAVPCASAQSWAARRVRRMALNKR
jgi:hypothetical protein